MTLGGARQSRAQARSVRSWTKALVAALGLLLVCHRAATAQAETARISGLVVDATNAIVPNARVRVESLANGFDRTTRTNDRGIYSVMNLPPGSYRVSVDADGFASVTRIVELPVGAQIALDVALSVGAVETTIFVAPRGAAAPNTETATLGEWITSKEVVELPTITRNPYDLALTAGNVSESDPSVSAGTPRGVGLAINGLRAPSTNVMLDGANNNDEFNAVVGQQVPLDSVQELGVLTNGFTAKYGRASGGIVNVVTRSGGSRFHGSAYEFNRTSKLASNSVENNANGIPRPAFDRNQFGGSASGPVVRNKLFFFSNTEWIRVRSLSTQFVFVPTPELLAASGVATQRFFSAFGALRGGLQPLATVSRDDLRAQGFDPCAGAAPGGPCLSFASSMPLFARATYDVPGDSGGGLPQDSYLHVTRFDYRLDDSTQFYARYARQSQDFFAGTNSHSPYAGFDTGQRQTNDSAVASLTRVASSATVMQTKLALNRFDNQQPLGANAPSPSLYFRGAGPTAILGTPVGLPGYQPFNPVPAVPLPFGGPQQSLQVQHDVTHVRAAHSLGMGGTYTYLQDNRTFGAFQRGLETLGATFGQALDNLLLGELLQFQAAVDPQGKYPCGSVQTVDCMVDLPVSPPSFSRSNRFHEAALYVEDSWKIARRLTVNAGLRWEYYGVQHNGNPRLDSNFYPARDQASPLAIRNGEVMIAEDSPVGGLTAKNWSNFAPRLGAAWDLFGSARTILRGGYGIGYERNFGLVTFNVIQNPPNYAVLSLTSGVDVPSLSITTDNFGPLAGSTGRLPLPIVSLRALDPHLKTASAHFWSASIEHEMWPNLLVGLDYAGSRGVNLYSISDINRPGAGNVYLGDPCTAGSSAGNPGTCVSRLRTTQYANINYRSNDGFSRFNALTVRARIANAFNSRLLLRATYTWSEAIDNVSSTFSEDPNNLTFGLLDPYDPQLSRGRADFDQRHRASLSAIWDVPVPHSNRFANAFLSGWTIASIFIARSGNPYSLYDCTHALSTCPYAMFDGPVPRNGSADPPPAEGQPNRFVYVDLARYPVNSTFVNPVVNISDFGPFPTNMSRRNAFTGPGFWNVDLALYKNVLLGERFSLQLRAEAFNAFNHANLEVIRSDNDVSSISFVAAQRRGRRYLQLGAKLSF
jgi:outer membrane receptor protein involved in Fe transport